MPSQNLKLKFSISLIFTELLHPFQLMSLLIKRFSDTESDKLSALRHIELAIAYQCELTEKVEPVLESNCYYKLDARHFHRRYTVYQIRQMIL
jgi:hypothetical protein